MQCSSTGAGAAAPDRRQTGVRGPELGDELMRPCRRGKESGSRPTLSRWRHAARHGVAWRRGELSVAEPSDSRASVQVGERLAAVNFMRLQPRTMLSGSVGPGVGAASGRGSAFRHLGWFEVCHHYGAYLRTEPARTQFELWERGDVLYESPLSLAGDLEDARHRYQELFGIECLLAAESNASSCAAELRMSVALERVCDLTALLRAAGQGAVLDLESLASVRDTLELADRLARLRRSARADASVEQRRDLDAVERRLAWGSERVDALAPVPQLAERLGRAIEPAAQGELRLADGASEALRDARRSLRRVRRSLTSAADRLVRSRHVAGALSDNFWTERNGRVVLPARSDSLGIFRAEGAILHGTSGSGQSFFVEPRDLVAANNEVSEAQLREAAEERRVRAELSAAVGAEAAQVASLSAALVQLDHLYARLALSCGLDGKTPRLSAAPHRATLGECRPHLHLQQAGHPLMLLDGLDPVRNDFSLVCGDALIISGPNAGGKTVALKTIGLCVLLAHAGVRVPTTAVAEIPLFDSICTDVGDEQSIAANLSTFTAHMCHVRAALQAASGEEPCPLVLFDEVAVGTDPEQGAALAEAIVCHLVACGASVVVTTHYERLKLLAVAEDGPLHARFHNAAVGFDIEEMRPTYRVRAGVPGSSSAFAVARRLGLPAEVLDEAERILGDPGVQVDALLRAIGEEREALAKEREAQERQRRSLAAREREICKREARALEKTGSRKQRALAAAVSELHALEDELRQQRKSLRRRGSDPDLLLPTRGDALKEAKVALGRLRGAALATGGAVGGGAVGGGAAGGGAAGGAPGGARGREVFQPVVGGRVWLRTLDAEGVVTAIKGDKITVQLPNLRTTAVRRDVLPAGGKNGSDGLQCTGGPRGSEGHGRITSHAGGGLVRGVEVSGPGSSSAVGRHFGADAKPVSVGFDNSLDLRGARVEEVNDPLEQFLDGAILRDQDVVIVLHGHGSGAVRSVVRERLRDLGHVHRYRSGLPSEGGDAVTVIWLGG